MKTALITGITGQDASYLAELLLEKGYRVIGIKRRTSTNTLERIEYIKHLIEIIEGDITDSSSMTAVINKYKPDEIYNLAAQSHVGASFQQPSYTLEVNTVGVINILEAVRQFSPHSRIYQASTSELFGNNYKEVLQGNNLVRTQDETTRFAPNSPYAVSKLASHHLCLLYRQAYNIYVSSTIMNNHESPRRGDNFVTRKITKWIGGFQRWTQNIKEWSHEDADIIRAHTTSGKLTTFGAYGPNPPEFPKLRLGNLKAKRDWSHAKDIVYAMWLILQKDEASDYILGSGETYSIEDFLAEAFKCINIDEWQDYVVIDPEFFRPNDVDYLCCSSQKSRERLHWTPKISFKELVAEMVESDINIK